MKINGTTILSAPATTTNYVLKQSSTFGTLVNTQIFDNGTNVGIGTLVPTAKLNIIGNLHVGSYADTSINGIENRTNKALFSVATDGVTNGNGTTITYSWANGGQGPLKWNNALGEVMRLSESGNVGIGTINPLARLHVSVANTGTKLIIEDSFGGAGAWGLGAGIVGVNDTHFTLKHESTSTIVLTATPDGNIGIGTINPEISALLDVSSTTKGFLSPRMRTSERDSISSPANGLIIFNTDSETIDVFTNGGGWKSLLF